MLLVGAIGVAGAIVFALATLRASDSSASMLAGLSTGLALSLATLVLVGFGLLLQGMRCDETCVVGASARWWETRDAWQWSGQLAFTVLALVTVIAATVQLGRRRYASSRALVAVMAIAVMTWSILLDGRS